MDIMHFWSKYSGAHPRIFGPEMPLGPKLRFKVIPVGASAGRDDDDGGDGGGRGRFFEVQRLRNGGSVQLECGEVDGLRVGRRGVGSGGDSWE
eukprot:COSAG02_NODE_7346_length_3053_cov_7.426713_2_plen_93_part_00